MRIAALAAVAGLLLAGCTGSSGRSAPPSGGSTAASAPRSSTAAPGAGATTSAAPGSSAAAVPHFAHIVVVIEENHSSSEIIGDPRAPYLNALGRGGAVLTNSYGVTHPSEPNYLALFSGSTQGLTDDSCPHSYRGDNLGHQLIARGQTFTGYSQSLPAAGDGACTAGPYARKHVPWTDFSDLPASVNQPMTAFPSDYSTLPRLSFVIPDLDHDMHDGTVEQADTWLHANLGAYADWARTHNSLLVVTWDEDDRSAGNRVPGLLVGAHLRSGPYTGRIDHFTMLRTLEAALGLPALGTAARRSPIGGLWMP
jgi:acid phosphatase